MQEWHVLSIQRVLAELKTKKDGLTTADVKKRQQKYGLNQLAREKKLSAFGIFISQFKNSLVYILLIAGAVSFALGEFIDSQIIFLAVVINVVVGFIQEKKASDALAELNKVAQLRAKVVRSGREQEVSMTELVPGDVVVLVTGDKIPADMRLMECSDLQINEAPLTGESQPVKKDIGVIKNVSLAERKNMVYLGTLVVEGAGIGVVVATGAETEIGRVATLLKDTEDEKTPIQIRLNTLSRTIAIVIVMVAIFIFFLGLIENHDPLEMFNTAVALAVAAIPEALVIGVTVVLTIGMQRILKRKGLVRKLVAAETLGSTTVICTDKTGTLTEGQMRVSEIYVDGKETNFQMLADKEAHASIRVLLQIGVACNDSVAENTDKPIAQWEVFGNSTEKALLLAGGQIGLIKQKIDKENARLDTVPFSSERKYMVTLQQTHSGPMLYYKGAPEKLLAFAEFVDIKGVPQRLTAAAKKKITAQQLRMSRQGLRVLALGYQKQSAGTLQIHHEEYQRGMVFVGFVGISDVLRPEAKEVLDQAKRSGIHTVIITGDNKVTAQAIARQLGLNVRSQHIMEGEELAKYTDLQLKKKVKDIIVFARVTPKDKLRIVRAWQARGEVVAMTGDGINDAPALKAADIGVALNSGTDVAKETSDLILLDNNFETIVAAVREGRVIFDNVRKVVLYLLAGSFGAVVTIFIYLVSAVGTGAPLPLVAAQILWLNIITDGLPDIALTFEPAEQDVLETPPPDRLQRILGGEHKILIALTSIATGFGTYYLYWTIWTTTGNAALAQTIAFAAVGTATLTYVFSIRNIKKMIWQYNPFSNTYLTGAVVISFLLQLVSMYVPFFQKFLGTVPLAPIHWWFIGCYSLGIIIMIEGIKAMFLVAGRYWGKFERV